MKRMRAIVGMLAVLGLVSAAAWACDKGGCSKAAAAAKVASGEATGGCHKVQSGDAVDAAVERVVAGLPKMTYRVGDYETNCPHAAQAKADETKAAITYVVGGESYGCKITAMNKLAELWQAQMPEVSHVAYSVGDETINCPKAAAAAAEAKHVSAKPVVAGVEFDCPTKAQAVAERLEAKLKEFGATTASAPATTEVKAGCCKKGAAAASGDAATASAGAAAAEAKTASGSEPCKPGCCKGNCLAAGAEDTPALANARKMVRQVVEFVVAQQQAPETTTAG